MLVIDDPDTDPIACVCNATAIVLSGTASVSGAGLAAAAGATGPPLPDGPVVMVRLPRSPLVRGSELGGDQPVGSIPANVQ